MWLDLHRHLEGSHSPRALLAVARQFDIKHDNFFDAATQQFRTPEALATRLVMAGPTDDASVFYSCIVKARAAYVSVDAIRELATWAFREAAEECDGFEMRLSLFSMTRTLLENTGINWRELRYAVFADLYARPILRAVIEARDKVQTETGKPMLLRLGLSRTFESQPHYEAMGEMALEHASSLVGLDVLGIVTGVDTEPLPPGLITVLESMRRTLPDLTIHAGEFAGHASVDRTLALAPRGIGHGIHSLQSQATLERLAREGVTLEVCPTSNHLLIPTALKQLGIAMPLKALQHAHVHCVLGSDDPTPMGTTFSKELTVARDGGVDMQRLEADMQRRWKQLTS